MVSMIGQEWLTYLGREKAPEEVKVLCLCALNSALCRAEKQVDVFSGCVDTSSRDVQLLIDTFKKLQNPGRWLECVGISAWDEEMDNFLHDRVAVPKSYSNGYALLKTGCKFPSTVNVYCGQDISKILSMLPADEKLLGYSVFQVFFDRDIATDDDNMASVGSEHVLTSIYVGKAEEIFNR